MLQNVCQIRCIYESHVILLFCFMASRGIFGRQGLACMTDIDPETFLGAFIILSFDIFQLHTSTSPLNSLFFAFNYPYLWAGPSGIKDFQSEDFRDGISAKSQDPVNQ